MNEDLTDPLAVLADDTRIAILRVLAEADGPLSFTELRERAGIRDSGRFGYHLRRLAAYFVRETDEGYELGHADERVLRAGDAATGGGEPQSTVATCPFCGESDCERLFHVHLAPGRGSRGT